MSSTLEMQGVVLRAARAHLDEIESGKGSCPDLEEALDFLEQLHIENIKEQKLRNLISWGTLRWDSKTGDWVYGP